MLRFNTTAVVTTSFLVLVAFSASSRVLTAQEPGGREPAAKPQVSRELWTLLGQWADGSKDVKKLHGKHQRRSYDYTFGIEKLATGEFWYEAPDKGRIDVVGVKITNKMLQKRKTQTRIERTKEGKPFQLQSDDPERWICDGTKVFDIDDPKKEARVVNLPPENRGQGIMNSPLPFLFGLPPQDAIKRFAMTIKNDFRPTHNLVWIEATPLTRGDAQNWSKADVMLNTETWLPKDVKLVNPAGTKATHYAFQDMAVNKNGIIEKLLGENPWDPNLPRDYKIHVIQPGQDQPAPSAKEKEPGVAIVPNVIGMPHDAATKLLLSVGIPADSISKIDGGPAPKQADTYHVRDQVPKAGTPMNKVKNFRMVIFNKPQAAAAARLNKPVAGPPANRAPVQQVGNRRAAQ